jgi:hypothetical protein
MEIRKMSRDETIFEISFKVPGKGFLFQAPNKTTMARGVLFIEPMVY